MREISEARINELSSNPREDALQSMHDKILSHKPDFKKLEVKTPPYAKFMQKIKFAYPGRISKNDAVELQTLAGYHPAGYGFSDFNMEDTQTTWTSWDNCD